MQGIVLDNDWKPVTTPGFLLASLALGLLVLAAFNSDGFVPLLDHANLAFHEAGHVIFGLFGPTLGLYGGTLGQLVFPGVAAVSFWRRGEPGAYALALAWLSENVLNIARYMADARAQILPLVGGGDHDWTAILSRWGALEADTRIAAGVTALGWIGLGLVWIWLGRRWRLGGES